MISISGWTSSTVLSLITGIQALGPFADARSMQMDVACFAEATGWTVSREWPVTYARRRGRIDLMFHKAREAVAAELDRLAPRYKSIAKLRAVPGATSRLIVLRAPLPTPYWLRDVLVVGTHGGPL